MIISEQNGVTVEKADVDNFVGNGQLQRMVLESGVNVYRVSFEAGARTNWHRHSGIQLLVIHEGECWLQKRGEAKHIAKAGDVVMFHAHEDHWHGASESASMVHYAVNIDTKTFWGEAVSDGEYKR